MRTKSILLTFLITLLLIVAVPVSYAETFSDVGQDHINYIAVNYLKAKDIVDGYTDGSYKPEEMIQRSEALKIILASQSISPSASGDTSFTDVSADAWYANYVAAALNKSIIATNSENLFEPDRYITRAEFIKMLLLANNFTPTTWGNHQLFSDIPLNAWFTPYMNYAGRAGLIKPDRDNNLYPSHNLTRGEVAQSIYFLYLIKNRTNNNLLFTEADKHMAQLEFNLANENLVTAKKAAEVFVSITQQTYRNNPNNKVSLGKAKLARAYDFLINGKISKQHNNYARGEAWEQLAQIKAQEAAESDSSTTQTADHIENMAQN